MEAKVIGAWTRNVTKGDAEAVMEDAISEAQTSGSEILVVDGNMIFGTDHIRSASMHAAKAIADGRNASESLAMETLLYVSGERQLSTAIRKMSVNLETEKVVLAVLTGDYSPGAGWIRLPDMINPVDRAALARFGVTDAEMSSVPENLLGELVLERVAAVDLIKR